MGDVAEACAFLAAVLVYLWLLVIPLPWTGLVLLAAIALSWRRRGLTVVDLGLGWEQFVVSLRAWRVLWIACAVLFLALGYGFVLRRSALERGLVYLTWSAAQQAVYQTMTFLPLRQQLRKVVLAAMLAGLAFAVVHAPNPVLVPATLAWGVGSSLLFERCRSVWGLALLQMMLSSMLLWVTPTNLHHGFRIGPYYYMGSTGTFAPPIDAARPGR